MILPPLRRDRPVPGRGPAIGMGEVSNEGTEEVAAVNRRLPSALLAAVAGSLDVVGLIGLGLFTAHITGNLALLIAHVVGGGAARLAPMLSVPVFIAALVLTRTLVSGLRSAGLDALRPLLLLECLLLAGCLGVGVRAGPSADPNTASTILAGMLAVSAMAVQNALPLRGAPPTTAVTGTITRLTLDVMDIVLARDATGAGAERAGQTWPTIAGFAVGCGLGAAGVATLGRWSLALPAALAVVALAIASWPRVHAAPSETASRWRRNRRAR